MDYDFHPLLRTLANQAQKLGMGLEDVKVIGKTRERLSKISFQSLDFKDSLNFMKTSLDKWVQSLLSKVDEDNPVQSVFKHTISHFRSQYPDKDLSLCLAKSPYPYEFFTDPSVLEHRQLPPREAFSSSLRFGETISPTEYSRAQEIWQEFEM